MLEKPPQWFKPEVTIGSICTVISLLIVAGGIFANVVATQANSGSEQKQTRSDLARLESTVLKGFNDVQIQIANLPDQKVRLEAVERRLAEVSASLEETRQRAIQTQADVQAYLRGTPPLRQNR